MPQRLLIVKLSSLGDVVHALPLADALRHGLGPDATLAWVVHRRFADLLQGNPNLNQLHILPDKRLRSLWAMGKTLRDQHFDTAIDPQGLLVSGLLARLSGARRRVGLDLNREGNRLFLTEASVAGGQRIHQVEKLLGFCDALGLPRLPVRRQEYLVQAEAATAERLLAPLGADPLIGCIIGTSTPDKSWSLDRWTELLCQLGAQGLRPLLLGGPGEQATAAELVQRTQGAVAADLTGKTTIRELASVLARCQVVIGGDTGPMHLAVAVGVPVVGLYGVTDPVRVGPTWGPAPTIVLDYATDDAPPAQRRTRHPLIERPLERIPAAAVTEATLRLLETPR